MGKWQKEIVPKVLDALEAYSYKPTVRGMFYRLVSDGLISNTFKTYRSLVAALTIARINGTIPIDAFVDNTRSIEDINDTYWSPEYYVDHLISQLKNAREDYFERGYIPRWKEQKYYVEVMVEKETLRPLFKQILFDREVRIVPNHGWSSMPHRHPVFNRLRLKQRHGYQVHVLYAGDFDPTGERMARNISLDLYLSLVKGLKDQALEQGSKWLNYVSLAQHKYKLFERIALTKTQVHDFGLEHLRNPDPEVKMKLNNDPNAEQFRRENNGELFQIEVDAMQKDPERFKQLVLSSVDKYYDNETYKLVMQEYTPKDIDDIIRMKIKFLETGNN